MVVAELGSVEDAVEASSFEALEAHLAGSLDQTDFVVQYPHQTEDPKPKQKKIQYFVQIGKTLQ